MINFHYEIVSLIKLGFPRGSVVKNLPTNAGDVGSILGSQRYPGGGYGNSFLYSFFFFWKTPWAEEPDRLEFKQLQRDGQDWMTEHTCTLIKLEKFAFSLSLSFFFLGTYCMLSDDNEGNVSIH